MTAPHTTAAGHPIDDRPRRPSKPPPPTAVPEALAPDGHRLEITQVATGISATGAAVGLNTARDGYLGDCECGERFVASWRLIHDYPPPASYLVADWLDHLLRADALDRDAIRTLRRDLEDAESLARYGRPFHNRGDHR